MISTIENLEKELKLGKLNSVYLLYGEEIFLLETCLKKIKNNFGERKAGINEIKLDESNISGIISDMETPAFGYEKKLIIVNNAGLFKKEGKRKSVANAELVGKIAKYIEENKYIIEQSLVIVFIESEAEKNDLYKVIDKIGVVCNFEELKPIEIIKRMKAICNGYKVNIDEVTLKNFIEACGTNMQTLINEIRKLIENVGENGTITKKEIDLLCIKQIESVIFDLTDNLGKKNIKQALEVLNNLIYAKEPIQRILITLYNHFKKLYIIKLAQKYNKSIEESLKLKANQSFLVGKYKMQAGYFKEQELRKILEELINLDANYKIGLIDLNIGLEAILCKYCS